MKANFKINIAKDFTNHPAGRTRLEGEASGEVFLVDCMLGKLLAAIIEDSVLEIDLTGIYGSPSSFISGAFGKIAFELGKVYSGDKDKTYAVLKKHIKFICSDSATKIHAFERELMNPITSK